MWCVASLYLFAWNSPVQFETTFGCISCIFDQISFKPLIFMSHRNLFPLKRCQRSCTNKNSIYSTHHTHTHKDIINRYARKCHLKYDSTRNIVLTKTCLKVPQRLWLILKCMRDPIWDIGSLTQLKFTGCNVSKRHINDIK